MVKEITVKTGGMTCTSCELAIARALAKVDGVLEAKADYASESTRIVYNEGKTNVDKIKDAIEGAGYDFGGEVKSKEKGGGFRLPFLGG